MSASESRHGPSGPRCVGLSGRRRGQLTALLAPAIASPARPIATTPIRPISTAIAAGTCSPARAANRKPPRTPDSAFAASFAVIYSISVAMNRLAAAIGVLLYLVYNYGDV